MQCCCVVIKHKPIIAFTLKTVSITVTYNVSYICVQPHNKHCVHGSVKDQHFIKIGSNRKKSRTLKGNFNIDFLLFLESRHDRNKSLINIEQKATKKWEILILDKKSFFFSFFFFFLLSIAQRL